jgi:metal-sulfur cluster biosynthetic enzyme
MANKIEAREDNPESLVQAALRDCYDPTLPCNMVDLGLIHRIALTPDPEAPGATIPGVPQKFHATITLTPTTTQGESAEAANAQLSAQIANRLAGLEQIIHTEVILLDHPAWTPQRITPAGRRTLGLDGNPSLVQIGRAQ